MIKYALACAAGHPFEAWFPSSEGFDDQAARGLIACPVCGVTQVAKQIMAPAVVSRRGSGVAETPAPPPMEKMLEAMLQVRKHVEENYDYVGDAFASEARAIHEGRSDPREIYGEATGKDIKSLIDDGVPIAPLPNPVGPADKGRLN